MTMPTYILNILTKVTLILVSINLKNVYNIEPC